MGLWVLLLALGTAWPAQATTMLDYRIRGYIEYRGEITGATACNDTFLTACARTGRLGLRAASYSLKVLPPPMGFAVLKKEIIDCPTGVAAITAGGGGSNQQADGTFPPDIIRPALVPATPFVVTPGGNDNSIQIRTLGAQQCIYEFQLMQATSAILGVQPVEFISIWGAASAHAGSPALAIVCSLAAALAALALR